MKKKLLLLFLCLSIGGQSNLQATFCSKLIKMLRIGAFPFALCVKKVSDNFWHCRDCCAEINKLTKRMKFHPEERDELTEQIAALKSEYKSSRNALILWGAGGLGIGAFCTYKGIQYWNEDKEEKLRKIREEFEAKEKQRRRRILQAGGDPTVEEPYDIVPENTLLSEDIAVLKERYKDLNEKRDELARLYMLKLESKRKKLEQEEQRLRAAVINMENMREDCDRDELVTALTELQDHLAQKERAIGKLRGAEQELAQLARNRSKLFNQNTLLPFLGLQRDHYPSRYDREVARLEQYIEAIDETLHGNAPLPDDLRRNLRRDLQRQKEPLTNKKNRLEGLQRRGENVQDDLNNVNEKIKGIDSGIKALAPIAYSANLDEAMLESVSVLVVREYYKEQHKLANLEKQLINLNPESPEDEKAIEDLEKEIEAAEKKVHTYERDYRESVKSVSLADKLGIRHDELANEIKKYYEEKNKVRDLTNKVLDLDPEDPGYREEVEQLEGEIEEAELEMAVYERMHKEAIKGSELRRALTTCYLDFYERKLALEKSRTKCTKKQEEITEAHIEKVSTEQNDPLDTLALCLDKNGINQMQRIIDEAILKARTDEQNWQQAISGVLDGKTDRQGNKTPGLREFYTKLYENSSARYLIPADCPDCDDEGNLIHTDSISEMMKSFDGTIESALPGNNSKLTEPNNPTEKQSRTKKSVYSDIVEKEREIMEAEAEILEYIAAITLKQGDLQEYYNQNLFGPMVVRGVPRNLRYQDPYSIRQANKDLHGIDVDENGTLVPLNLVLATIRNGTAIQLNAGSRNGNLRYIRTSERLNNDDGTYGTTRGRSANLIIECNGDTKTLKRVYFGPSPRNGGPRPIINTVPIATVPSDGDGNRSMVLTLDDVAESPNLSLIPNGNNYYRLQIRIPTGKEKCEQKIEGIDAEVGKEEIGTALNKARNQNDFCDLLIKIDPSVACKEPEEITDPSRFEFLGDLNPLQEVIEIEGGGYVTDTEEDDSDDEEAGGRPTEEVIEIDEPEH